MEFLDPEKLKKKWKEFWWTPCKFRFYVEQARFSKSDSDRYVQIIYFGYVSF